MRRLYSFGCAFGASAMLCSGAMADQHSPRAVTLDQLEREMSMATDRPSRLLPAFVPGSGDGFSSTFIAAGAAPEGDMPQKHAMNATKAIVINRDSDTVTFFTLPGMAPTTVAGGDFATDVQLTPDGTKAVVVNLGDNTVQVWNMATNALIATIPVTGLNPYKVKITPDGTKAIVGVIEDAVTSRFSVINLTTNTETLSFTTAGQGVWLQQIDVVTFNFWNLFTQFDVNNTSVYLADLTNNLLRVYTIATGVESAAHALNAAGGPVGVDVASDSSFAIVQHQGTSFLSKVALPGGALTSIDATPAVFANGLVELTPTNSHAVVTTAVGTTPTCEFINMTTLVRTPIPAVGSVWDPAFDGNVGVLPAADTHLVNLTTLAVNGSIVTPTVFESAASTGRTLVSANRRFEELQLINTAGAGSLVSQTQTGTPAEGDNSRIVAVAPNGGFAFSANVSSANVTKYNLGTNTVAANISTGTIASSTQPFDVAITPDGSKVVVPNVTSGLTKILDANTNAELGSIATPAGISVAINPAGTRAYVSSAELAGKVYVINLATNALITTINLGVDNQFGITYPGFGFPQMTLTPDGSRLIVPVVIADQVIVINTATNTIAKTIVLGGGTGSSAPLRAAVSPDGTKCYVSETLGGQIALFNPSDGSTTFSRPISMANPIDVAMDTAGTFIYVNSYSFTFPVVYAIDTTTHGASLVNLVTPARSLRLVGSDLFAASVGDGIAPFELVHIDANGSSSTVLGNFPLSGIPLELDASTTTFIGTGLPRVAVVGSDPDGIDAFGDPSNTATLTDLTVTHGSTISGGLTEVLTSDNLYHRSRSQFGFTSSEPNFINVRIGATSPLATPATIDLTVEARLNQNGGNMKLRLRNWNTNLFEQVHQYAIGTTETTQNHQTTGANRVRVSDNRIEFELHPVVFVLFGAGGFDLFTDWVKIDVN